MDRGVWWDLGDLQSTGHKVKHDWKSEHKILWEGHVHTAIFKMDNQQKPIV